ncbi:kinase-like domain-containing protein [Cladorrhinum sp. PSN332]|nr:kinase-like domain-containing protein [Cladorrhinum sp. PSN332]
MSHRKPSHSASPVDDHQYGEFVETEGEYPDDASDIYMELDHAPTNTLGTYLDGINGDLEPLEEYQQGGFHPVHLGDLLGSDNRYRIIHKLGYGGFGTVWLSRDTKYSTYVALKVMIGDITLDQVPDLNLINLDKSIPGAQHIAAPLDQFSITGPNGTHQCIILPVLGPRVSPDLWLQLDNDPAPILRKIAHQAAQAMDFLHKNKICHGDFRPSNILIKLTNLDHLSEDDLLSLIGKPTQCQVKSESADELPAGSPRYLVHSADLSEIGSKYLTEEICVIDFGESYHIDSPPEGLGIPENYLPPEVLLQNEEESLKDLDGLACDIWALGCTLFEIRQQMPLFYMIYDRDELLAEHVRFFGKLPEKWWAAWTGKKDWFDEKGRFLRDVQNETEEWSLEIALSKPCEVVTPERRVLSTPEEEQKAMVDLLHRIFRFEPGKRLSAEEVMGHGWFRM